MDEKEDEQLTINQSVYGSGRTQSKILFGSLIAAVTNGGEKCRMAKSGERCYTTCSILPGSFLLASLP